MRSSFWPSVYEKQKRISSTKLPISKNLGTVGNDLGLYIIIAFFPDHRSNTMGNRSDSIHHYILLSHHNQELEQSPWVPLRNQGHRYDAGLGRGYCLDDRGL